MVGGCDVPGVVGVWWVGVCDVPGVVGVWWVGVTCQVLLLCVGCL